MNIAKQIREVATLNGDTYEQIREAEKNGVLADLLLDVLDSLSDEEYKAFRKEWSRLLVKRTDD